jgi:hypothetical protein
MADNWVAGPVRPITTTCGLPNSTATGSASLSFRALQSADFALQRFKDQDLIRAAANHRASRRNADRINLQ